MSVAAAERRGAVRRAIAAGATVTLAGAGLAASPGSPLMQSFQVSAAIVAGCSIATSGGGSSWGSIDLGTIAGVGDATAAAGLVTPTGAGLQLNCTPGTAVSVTADNGLYAAGGTRQLGRAGGSDRIPYTLFANGSATAWTTQAIALTFPAGTAQLGLPVSASIALSAPRAAGTYSDTVRITVSW